MLLKQVSGMDLHGCAFERDGVYAVPVFLDGEAEFEVQVRLGGEDLANFVWDGDASETVFVPQVLAERGRDPGAAAGEDGEVGVGEVLEGGDDLDGGGAGAEDGGTFVGEVVASWT